jgi:adenylate kinase family enzyme
MKKVIIIGASGAGKTTLAKKLSTILNIPHTELDAIYHQAGWQPINDAEFIKQVKSVTRKPEWILCGNYYSKLSGGVWYQADTVIWCDYSLVRIFSRLLRRTLIRGLTGTELWNGNSESLYTNLLTKDSLLLWMLKSRKKQRQRYNTLFDSPSSLPQATFIRLKSPKDTYRLFDQIKKSSL